MKIVDLSPEHHPLYFKCLEDWSDEMKEAGDHKERWYGKYKDKGLKVKLAVNDEGTMAGMVQYMPIEESLAEGKDLYFVPCVWVHGHKQGPGNLQKKGTGQALLRAAEEDARSLGAKGMVAWGLWLPIWMRASWFKKQGYVKADRDSIRVLVWKPFAGDALRPRWIRRKKLPTPVPGQVTIHAFINGWCPVQGINFERARRAAADFGDKVRFEAIDTSDRDTFLEWGISDGIYINGKDVSTGPPLTYEKLHKLLSKAARRIR